MPLSCAHRTKQEAALRSTQAQREALDRRVAEQERGIEARLDAVEEALQVGAGAAATRRSGLQCREAVPLLHAVETVDRSQRRPGRRPQQTAEPEIRVSKQRRVFCLPVAAEHRGPPLPAPPQGYHSMANRLALVPATAKRAEGVAFEVRLDRGATSASEMINVDLKVGCGVWDVMGWLVGGSLCGAGVWVVMWRWGVGCGCWAGELALGACGL